MSKCEITWNQYEVWSDRVDSLRRAAYGKPSTPRDKVADAVTRPTPPYTDMSFGMGRENNPGDLHDTAFCANVLRMAERQDGPLLSIADGSGMGIRLSCRNNDSIFLR